MITYNPSRESADTIEVAITTAVNIAQAANDTVELTFNDTTVTVYKSYVDHIYREWIGCRDEEK